MVEFKLVISDVKTGKSYKSTTSSEIFKNKKIGDNIKGDELGLAGYELQVTGGSDDSGFPMRRGIRAIRKKILLSGGVGIRKLDEDGNKKYKTVSGEAISLKTSQINLKITKEGSKKLEELFKKEEAPKEGQ